MNKKLILILLSAMMFCSASYAQKVVKSGSAVIIDCSDMDPKFYDSNKKPRTTTATNNSSPTNGVADIASLESNAKVYKKFEVHKTDNSTATDWKNAIDVCAGLDSNGTGWRLPTLRELMLIWILKEKLVANNISPFTVANYWSATQIDSDNAWYVYFTNGSLSNYYVKAYSNIKVRCVRDL